VLKRDIAFRLLAFLLLRSALVSSSGVRYFSSISAEVRAFLHLGIVKLLPALAPYVGNTTFFKDAIAGHGKLQHYEMDVSGVIICAAVLEA
jgi:hypothetical protein